MRGCRPNNAVYASDTSLIDPFTGNTPVKSGVVNSIYVKAAEADLVDSVQTQIAGPATSATSDSGANEDDDFSVRSLNEIAEASANATQVMTLLLAAVASISLLVGGIGIMNIMLVSVTERTREIGIRMAIGARRLHILLQFLVESSLLSILGGVAGIIAGYRNLEDSVRAGALADAGLVPFGGGRLRLRGGGRSVLRLVSGAQGVDARSDRRAALRIVISTAE